SDRKQQVRSADPRVHFAADDISRDGVAVACHPLNLAADVGLDTFAVQDIGDGLANVFVLACNQVRRALDYGYFAAETSIDLREFKADIAAAQNDEMRRQEVHVQDRAVGEVANIIKSGNGRRQRASSDVDEYPIGLQDFVGDLDRMRASKSGMAFENRAALEIFQPALDALARVAGYMILSGLYRFHVDSNVARDFHPEIGGAP